MTRSYMIETLWWIAVLSVIGQIIGMLLRWPRRKEKPNDASR